MTAWHEQRMASLDTETTGVDVENDRIVTCALLRVGGGQEIEARTWLIDPGVPVPKEASDIHGVTTERAQAEGVPARAGIESIAAELEQVFTDGLPLVVYNAAFDLTIFDRELRRHGEPAGIASVTPSLRPIVDPFCIDKHADRWRRGKRTLDVTCAHYNVVLDEAHAAHGDALAAARLAWRLACVYPDDCADLEQLHDKQAAWAAEQATGLADYFRRLAAQQSDPVEREALLVKADGVDGAWPLRPFREAREAVA